MELRCTQCGATLEVAPDVRLLACPYCGTALAVSSAGALFNEVMRPTVGAAEAAAHVRRFLAGRRTVAGLDRQARLEEPELEYFPFWAFTVRGGAGERTVLMPAAPDSLQGLQGLTLPAGETRTMSAEVAGGARVVPPEIPLETAEAWLREREGSVAVERRVLYHLPLYRIAYHWRGRRYAAAVDAVSGRVFHADYPAKAEAPYLLVAGLALAVFGIEGLVIGNLLVKLAVYLVSSPPILLIAWLTARRV